MFEIGDRVVHAMHGAGIIVDIEVKQVLGKDSKYYILKMPLNEMRVMVPVSKADEVGVRKILQAEEMDKIFEVLKEEEEEPTQTNWNRRYRYNLDRIKSGDIEEIARVVSSLQRLDSVKSLSTGERKMLNNAKRIITSEMVLVYEKSYDTIVEEVDRAIDAGKEG